MSSHGGDRSRNPANRGSGRGQSTLIGIVLLLGMVGTLSVGLFLVGGEAVSSLEQQSERERVESAFVELSHQMAAASDNRSGVARTIDLDVGQQGTVVREETGTINVSSDALESGAIDDLTIGTIEWEDTDGSVLAYEAGAVFRERGNETQVVSAPAISYETETDTLTLPVITATGDEHLGSGDVTLSSVRTTAYQDATVVENESITITIQSEYYRGWETFFREQAGDASIQDVDHENQTVEVEAGYLDLESAFDSGVTYSEDVDDFKDQFGDQARVGNMPEMDPVIEKIGEDARDDPDEDLGILDSDEQLSDGLYYASEVNLQGNDDDVEFNLSDGNATLFVDGDFTMDASDASFTVDSGGTDNVLRIYVTGNFDFWGGEMRPDPSYGPAEAKQLQVYGTSELHGHFRRGEFHGTFYAASDSWEGPNQLTNSDYQVHFHSNPTFEGGLVVHSANIHANAGNFDYDDSLEGSDFDAYPDEYQLPPQLTYLNVAHHEIEVRNS